MRRLARTDFSRQARRVYSEHTVRDSLKQIAMCGWQRSASRGETVRVVPDACSDIIWTGAQLIVAGPDTHVMPQWVEEGCEMAAIRFAPGCAPQMFAVPATALRNARPELVEFWGERARKLQAQLERARDVGCAQRLLEAAAEQQLMAAGPPEAWVQRVVQRLSPGAPGVRSIAKLAAELGMTERQLLRRCNAAFGYGPKFLERVLRFQGFLGALHASSGLGFADLAQRCGYTDQAHLAHETAELARATPTQLRSEAGV